MGDDLDGVGDDVCTWFGQICTDCHDHRLRNDINVASGKVTEVRVATNEEVENGRAEDAMGLMIGEQDDDADYDNLDDLTGSDHGNHPTLH